MIGLKRGTVHLMAHQPEWIAQAEIAITELKEVLGDTAIDIQHIGSTAIASIHAKPIIDLVIGVGRLDDILSYKDALMKKGYLYRGEDVPGQLLFVKGDFENELRTHHIHVVRWNGREWNNYINFRNYLNANPDRARAYDICKQNLANKFSEDRRHYTQGKQELIAVLLKEAFSH